MQSSEGLEEVANIGTHSSRRAPTMSQQELCIISTFYADNYESFHAALAGSSRHPSVKQKKAKLTELSRQLVAAGYPERTTSQLDQRIRDTLRNVKTFSARQREEAHQTGGGLPIKRKAAPHIAIVLERIGSKPRVKGLRNPIEICSSAKGNQNIFSPSPSVEFENESVSSSAINTPAEHNFKRTKVEQLHDLDISETELNDQIDGQSTNHIVKECCSSEPSVASTILKRNERSEAAEQRTTDKKQLEHHYLQLRIKNEENYARLLDIQLETAQITLDNARLERQKLEMQIANELKKQPSNTNSNPEEVFLLPIGEYN